MDRLTTKVDDIYTCSYCENQKAVDKLGAFEDFMESNGFESLEEVKKIIDAHNFAKKILSNESIPKGKTIRLYEQLLEAFFYKHNWQKLKDVINKTLFLPIRKNGKSRLTAIEQYTLQQVLEVMEGLEKEFKKEN